MAVDHPFAGSTGDKSYLHVFVWGNHHRVVPGNIAGQRIGLGHDSEVVAMNVNGMKVLRFVYYLDANSLATGCLKKRLFPHAHNIVESP